MSWLLHITVAAVIEKNSKFLLVREIINKQITYNQPAGHLEENESLLNAVTREVHEETGMHFEPQAISGIYHWRNKTNRDTYIRFAFKGHVKDTTPVPIPDKKIIGIEWLSMEEILALPQNTLRTSMVIKCIEDYQSGTDYPLSLLHSLGHKTNK